MDLESVDHILTTTRSVRKRLDLTRAVDPELIEECIEIAIQAPTGSNLQGWYFMVVTDADKRSKLADLYRRGYEAYYEMQARQPPEFDERDLRGRQRPRVSESSGYLSEHMQDVPVLVIPCIERVMKEAPYLSELASNHPSAAQASMYGSILPATWSLMLAMRSRGLGSAWTTLHLIYESEAAEVLGIPDHVTQAAMLPVAYFTGSDFKPARRRPAREMTYWNSWRSPR